MPVSPARASAERTVDPSVLAIVSRLAGPRGSVALAEALEYRVSTAIAIGLLQTGDRLPSEEVMAQVLGVSALTFRQSLVRLRVRNLVTTRAGRGGGSVVSPRPEDLEALAHSVFTSTSASEVADLGTTFGGLFSHAARLAALRHDQFDAARMRGALQALTEAKTAVHRRRASMLFIVTTTSAARSETLMDIVVPVIGALQSMAWLDKYDDLFLQMVNDATQILDAVTRSEADSASHHARQHSERLTSHLVRRRAEAYAEGVRTGGGFDLLIDRLDGVRSTLEQVNHELGRLKPTRSGSATALDELFRGVVDADDDLVRGAGIAYAPDMLPGRPLWMDWWDSGNADGLAFKTHTFSNASLQYYDYRRMAWFTEPLRKGAFSAQGPYLDRGGIERVTVTVSLPVTTPTFVGSVLGADLWLGRIGEIFFADAHEDLPVVLLDGNGRVVASATSGWMPGDVAGASRVREVSGIDSRRWPGLSALGWCTARVL